jgi:hypothetical protein
MFKADRTSMNRRQLLACALGGAGTCLVAPAFAGPDLIVVVHPSVTEAISMADLGAIFTTRRQSWTGGKRIVPFNFPAKHEVRVAFDQAVLGMDPDAVARYWIDRKIRGGNPPPKQITTAQLVVRLVEKLDGAIGYVPRDTDVGSTRVASTL